MNNLNKKARHIKRMMAAAEKAGIKVLILTNKEQLNILDDINLN